MHRALTVGLTTQPVWIYNLFLIQNWEKVQTTHFSENWHRLVTK